MTNLKMTLATVMTILLLSATLGAGEYTLPEEPLYRPLELPAAASAGKEGFILDFNPDTWLAQELSGTEWKLKQFPVAKEGDPDFKDPGLEEKFFSRDANLAEWTDWCVPWVFSQKYPSGDRWQPHWNGVSWLARDFAPPAEWQALREKGWRILLRFYGVFPQADVWVNGESAGATHRSRGGISFEFDVTGAVTFGVANRLAVRHFVSMKGYRYRGRSGIFQPVRLVCVPPLRASRLLLAPAIAPASLRAKLALTNHGAPGMRTLTARLEPFNLPDEAPRTFDLGKKEIPAGESELELAFDTPDIKLWTVAEPNLYFVTILADGEPVARERFGFRTFEAKGHSFYLNGERIKLMGFPTWESYANRWGCNKDNRGRQALYAAKAANINCIRPHSGAHGLSSPTFLNLCDEIGMLIYDEFYYVTDYQREGRLPQRKEEFREYVFQHHNHPCVVMWDHGGNEIYSTDLELVPIFTSYYKLLKEIDLQHRPSTSSSGRLGSERLRLLPVVEKVDFADNHFYPGYYNGSFQELKDAFDKDFEAVQARLGDKPYVNCEYGVPGDLNRYRSCTKDIQNLYKKAPWGAEEKRKYIEFITSPTAETGNFLRIRANWSTGRKYVLSYNDIACDSAAFSKRFLDIFRLQGERIAGGHQNSSWYNLLLHSHLPNQLDQWVEQGLGEDLIDRSRDSYFTHAGFYIFKRGYNPAYICLDFHDENTFAPGAWQATAHLLNDSPQAYERVQAVAQLRAPSGKMLQQLTVWEGALAANAHLTAPVAFDLEDGIEAGDYKVELYLLAEDGAKTRLSDNFYNLYIDAKTSLYAPLVAGVGQTAVYDVQEQLFRGLGGMSTAAVLREFGVDFKPLEDFSNLKNFSRLIIGCQSFDKNLMENGKVICDWVKAGGRLLCFEQNMAGPLPFLPEVSVVSSPGATFSEILVREHPIFTGLEQQRFQVWNGNRGLLYNMVLSPLNEGLLSVGTTGDFGATDAMKMISAAYAIGTGEMVFSQYEITNRFKTDPVAARLLRNLVAYLLANKQSEHSLAFQSEGRNLASAFLESERAMYVDISGVTNSQYQEGENREDNLGAFFKELTPGISKLSGGVPFQVIDPAQNHGRGCLVLKGKRFPGFPVTTEPVTVGRKLTRLFFLHTLQYASHSESGAPVYTATIKFGDGGKQEVKFLNGDNLGDWWKAKDLANARVVFTAGQKNLYLTEVLLGDDPKEVSSLEFSSTGGATPIIFAVTGELAKP
jgi:beta-galactosidase